MKILYNQFLGTVEDADPYKKDVRVLVDCHIHMVLDGEYWRSAIARHAGEPDVTYIGKTLARYRETGFTYLRDGGDRWGVGKTARELAPEYGIRYRTPLAPLHKAGHYGSIVGISFEDTKEYQQLVKEQKAQGADFIKIMISGLMDFNRYGALSEAPLTGEEIRQMVAIAHDAGLSVMAHANGESAYWAAIAGVDSVEHGAYLQSEALFAMKENGTVWVPTVSTVANLRGKGRYDETAVQQILGDFYEKLRQFEKLGGYIASGSDAGAWQVPHGSQETDFLLEAGVSPQTIEKSNQVIIDKF